MEFFFHDTLAFIINPFFLYEAFNVFQSGQGAQGKLLKPSQQQLDTVFETHDDVEVITIILEKGDLQNSSAITTSATLNITRGSLGSVSVDRNKSSSGI